MNRIDGKVAVITGGTQGLGAAIANLFAEAGALGIVIVGRDQKKGETVASEISKTYGIQAKMITADLEKIEDVQRIIAETDTIFGRVDILVNSAGLTDRGNILDTNPDLFNRMIAVNTRAPFFLIQDAAKIMIREHIEGRIINIGSMSEHAGQSFLCPYATSKGALATLTRNVGFALMRNQIHVNQLSIGWMNSDHERKLIAETGDPDFIDRKAATKPFKRILDTKEVAKAVLWMASDDSGMMTGTIVNFDQTIWGAYDDAPSPENALDLPI